jgi:hypothetical protein
VVRRWFGGGSAVVRRWFGGGSEVVRRWFGGGSEVVRRWFSGGSAVVQTKVYLRSQLSLSEGYFFSNSLQGKHSPKQQNPTLLSNSQTTTPHTEIAPQTPRPQNNLKKDSLIYYGILKVLLAELGRPQNGHFLKALRRYSLQSSWGAWEFWCQFSPESS